MKIIHPEFDQKLSKAKGFIFDMDGLMLDTEKLSKEAWLGAARELQLDVPMETCHKAIGRVSADISRVIHEDLGAEFPVDEFMDVAQTIYESLLTNDPVPQKAGIETLLGWLKTLGYPLVVATSTVESIARHKLESAGLLKYFEHLVTGDMVSEGKPHPEIFIKAAGVLQLEAVECVVFEDSYNGIRGAHAAAALPVMIPDLLPVTDEMRELCVAIFPSLEHFQEYAAKVIA